MTGEGADELFAGYGWYSWAGRRMPMPLAASAAQRVLDGRRGKRTMMALFAGSFEDQYFENVLCSVFQRAERARLFSPDFQALTGAHRLSDSFGTELERSRNFAPLSRMQFLDTAIWLEGDPLTKVDRMSMAASLEARVPFLDYRLVELAARIPPQLKLAGSQSKAILRQAFADLLPPAIVNRRKHAFDVPVAEWLRNELREWTLDLATQPAIVDSGLFNSCCVKKLAEGHLGGRDYAAQLWALLTWSLWLPHR